MGDVLEAVAEGHVAGKHREGCDTQSKQQKSNHFEKGS
jgi:hypothetical protein